MTETTEAMMTADRMVHVTLRWCDGEEEYTAKDHYDSKDMANAGLLDDKLGIDEALVEYTSLNGATVGAHTWTRGALMERYTR